MNSTKSSKVLKFLHEESGQALPWISLMMVLMIGMTGFVVDMGRAMVINNRLQAGTQAAALAGANAMPNSDFENVANNFSSSVNNDNYSSTIGNVVTSVVGYCSNFVANTLGIDCVATSSGSAKVNALVVTQTVTVPTTFMRLLGIPSIQFSSTATAAWKGAARLPYNVAVVVDTTQSMTDTDSGTSDCNDTERIACAMSGIQDFLVNLYPCSVNEGCGGSDSTGDTTSNNDFVTTGIPYGLYPNSFDEVALYTFPGLNNATTVVADDDCTEKISSPGSTYSTAYYGYGGSSVATIESNNANGNSKGYPQGGLYPYAPYYQVVAFSSDYMASNGAGKLNSSSTLVKAVGGGSTCSDSKSGGGGIQTVGGAGTYYAGIIYQAQSDLYANYALRKKAGQNTSNVMIVLSDGDAAHSSWETEMGSSYSSGSTSDTYTATGGAYGSVLDECQQAVNAAQEATNGTYPTTLIDGYAVPQTTIYAVAYGSETTGCQDSSISGTTVSGQESLEPCDTMEQMSSSWITQPGNQYLDFYSDYAASGGTSTCISDAHPATSLQSIFTQIAGTLSSSKIIQTAPGCSASNTASCN